MKLIKLEKVRNGKYLKNGSYSVVISAIFIVIVIVINMIVGSLPSKYTEFDVSSQKLYSIAEGYLPTELLSFVTGSLGAPYE